MNLTYSERPRSFAAEGTVYWLIISAILAGILAVTIAWTAGTTYFVFTVALAIIYLGLAYLCWNLKNWGFLATAAFAIVVSGLAFGIIYSPIGTLLLLLQLQIILFAYSAFRERKK